MNIEGLRGEEGLEFFMQFQEVEIYLMDGYDMKIVFDFIQFYKN